MSEPTAREVGEFGLITAVTARLPTSDAVLLGPGDDASVLSFPAGRVVATTDVLVEGVHFRRDWSTGLDVGHKAAAANLADVAAMGGVATALLVGLAAPGGLPLQWALDLADGLAREAGLVGAVVVGGDTVTADQVVVSVTALGTVERWVTRSGARPGDLVVLAGRTGRSAAGLRLLQEGVTTGPLVDAHRRPSPPYALGPVLAAAGATAMCDVSDGLVADLGHVARASGVAVDLSAAALADDEVSLSDVLTGGEDHALVATLPPGPVPDGCRVVGRVLAGEGVTVDSETVAGGWEHWR